MNRPRPVLTKAGIAGLVTSLAGVLTFLGYSDAATKLDAEAQGVAGGVIGLVLLASHLLPALSAQKDVTPKHSPQADDGMPLIRADQAAPAAAAQHITMNVADGTDPAQLARQVALAMSGSGTGATVNDAPVPVAVDVPDADAVLAAADAIHPQI